MELNDRVEMIPEWIESVSEVVYNNKKYFDLIELTDMMEEIYTVGDELWVNREEVYAFTAQKLCERAYFSYI